MKKIIILAIFSFALFSCDAKDSCLDSSWSFNKKTKKCEYSNIITTSIVPIASITKNISSEDIIVKNIVSAGKSPHNFDLKASNLIDIENSKWIIIVWVEHIDSFLNKKIQNKNTLNLSENIELIEIWEEHSHHDTSQREGVGHKNHQKDPHIWNSPENVKIIAGKIKDFLVKITPENKETLKKNYKNFIKSVDKKVNDFKEKTKWKKQKYFIVFHDAYNYLFRDLGINSEKKLVFRKSVLNEPNSKNMQDLIEEIKEHNIKIAFIEPQFKSASFNRLAKKYEIQTYVLDPLGQDETANWYLKNLENNLESLEKLFEF